MVEDLALMPTFITEKMVGIQLRLEAPEAVMEAAELAVFGPRWGADGKSPDQHWSYDTWEPMDEDDYPPDARTRMIEIYPLNQYDRDKLSQFWAVAAACGADGEVLWITRTESTYAQVVMPPRPVGEQNFVRITSDSIAADLQKRIAKARDALAGDAPFRAGSVEA